MDNLIENLIDIWRKPI